MGHFFESLPLGGVSPFGVRRPGNLRAHTYLPQILKAPLGMNLLRSAPSRYPTRHLGPALHIPPPGGGPLSASRSSAWPSSSSNALSLAPGLSVPALTEPLDASLVVAVGYLAHPSGTV